MIVIAYRRPMQTRARENPSLVWDGRYQVLLLGENLLAINSWWERESWLSLRVWSLVSQSHSNGRSHSQAYVGSMNWSFPTMNGRRY